MAAAAGPPGPFVALQVVPPDQLYGAMDGSPLPWLVPHLAHGHRVRTKRLPKKLTGTLINLVHRQVKR